jgi:hypothetical protein
MIETAAPPFLRHGNVGSHPHSGKERQGKHSEGDVPVPAMPRADLVVSQADLLLGEFEALLYGPAPAGNPRQSGQRGLRRAEDHIVGEGLGILVAAPDQQPVLPQWLLQSGRSQAGLVIKPISLAARPRPKDFAKPGLAASREAARWPKRPSSMDQSVSLLQMASTKGCSRRSNSMRRRRSEP